MPADFLIDEHGRIVEACYGTDASDRISIERIERFLVRGLLKRAAWHRPPHQHQPTPACGMLIRQSANPSRQATHRSNRQ